VSPFPVVFDSQYEVRSGWKFVGYSVLLVGLFYVSTAIIVTVFGLIAPTWLLTSPEDLHFVALNVLALFLPSMGALLVMSHFVDRAPLAVFGVTFHKGWLRDVGAGLVVAAAMIVVLILCTFPFARFHVEWNMSAAALPAIVATVLVLGVGAFNEELVFRGYPFQIFLKGIGVWPAMLLISLIFALLHYKNEGATVLSTLNTWIAGVFLCCAYLRTRSIWLPYGIHVGWNVGTAVVVGVPVSGIDTASILKTQVQAPAIISGGVYGPENSIIGTFVFLLGVVVIRHYRFSSISREVQAALDENAAKVYIAS
jgi:membrane protease YdiL (CAAX protease family)